MNATHFTTLLGIYLQRSRRAVIAVTLSMLPLALLFSRKSGYQPADIAKHLTVVCVMLPLALGGVVAKCKADGALLFLASLPVDRRDHARAWFAAAAILSLPMAVLTVVVCRYSPIVWSTPALALIGFAAFVAMVAIVTTLVSVQLKATPATALVPFLWTALGLALVMGGLEDLMERAPQLTRAVLQSQFFVPGMSTLSWMTAGAIMWWAWQRIGERMTNYVGDPPAA